MPDPSGDGTEERPAACAGDGSVWNPPHGGAIQSSAQVRGCARCALHYSDPHIYTLTAMIGVCFVDFQRG